MRVTSLAPQLHIALHADYCEHENNAGNGDRPSRAEPGGADQSERNVGRAD